MLDLSHGLVLGYHGCDQSTAERLLSGADFKSSENDYDWLGHGIYFWQHNPKRGLSFAHELAHHPTRKSTIKSPAVVGAVIHLGHCLDLMTEQGLSMLADSYAMLEAMFQANPMAKMPVNSPDLLRRNLDCAVVNALHIQRKETGQPPFDTVRGVFEEGAPLYPDSAFRQKTHIQIAVRERACILGVFRVPKAHLD
ncbi:hypothetical protein F1654_00660 [Alkalicaulis satelles]|uniref:Uncharacterized protein n=1 Tax=Alkalicaulis satelles TaxID=2609175 RepID=A0A5M6ZKR1_9PROT|nr:hypothetical protein [Alkalicaulis satelles]KAA5804555.1 hypothetical protein F1654_00660 [Alkalicaulis satelles]